MSIIYFKMKKRNIERQVRRGIEDGRHFFLASAGHRDLTSGLVALQTKSVTSLYLY